MPTTKIRKNKSRAKKQKRDQDMFLLNVGLQGPVTTHSYGYQDNNGDLRTGNNFGHKLIFDPQNPIITAQAPRKGQTMYKRPKKRALYSVNKQATSNMNQSYQSNQQTTELNPFESVKKKAFENKRMSSNT